VGIRFRCHQCGHELHVKDFQGGKRSKCPECETKFRIPTASAEQSIPIREEPATSTSASTASSSSGSATGVLAFKQQQLARPAEPQEESAAEVRDEEVVAADSVVENDADNREFSEPQSFQPQAEPLNRDAHAAARPHAIAQAPDATWYVRPPAGGQYGPAPAEIFCEWLTENRVTRDSLVWRDGWPHWLVAGDVFVDYFGAAVPQSPAPLAGSALSPPSATSPVESSPLDFVAPVTLSERTLAARKRQRRRDYLLLIGLLATISIGLVIALIALLMQ
jgi:phage FluMu protein Com